MPGSGLSISTSPNGVCQLWPSPSPWPNSSPLAAPILPAPPRRFPSMPEDVSSAESQLIKRIHRDLIDDYDEELEMEREDWEKLTPDSPLRPLKHDSDQGARNQYFKELF